MSDTCKTCQYWGGAWPNPQVNKRRCDLLSTAEPDMETDGIIDDDGTSRAFYTGPDFGCIFHVPILSPVRKIWRPSGEPASPEFSATAVEGGTYTLRINGIEHMLGPIKLGPNWFQLEASHEITIQPSGTVLPAEVKEFCVIGITQEQWDAEHSQ